VPLTTLPTSEISSIFAVMKRTFSLSIMSNTKYSVERYGLVLNPIKTDEFGIFDTDHLDRLHDMGYEDTKARMEEIKAMAEAGK